MIPILGTVLSAVIKPALATVITKQVMAAQDAPAQARISMTKAGANGMGAAALMMVDWAGVQTGDPAACGQLAALAVTWALTLYGRWRAERA